MLWRGKLPALIGTLDRENVWPMPSGPGATYRAA